MLLKTVDLSNNINIANMNMPATSSVTFTLVRELPVCFSISIVSSTIRATLVTFLRLVET